MAGRCGLVRRPFSFGGALSDASVPAAARAEVEDWVARLDRGGRARRPERHRLHPGRRGSAAFPRDQSASHRDRRTLRRTCGGGLFDWHLDACTGQLPEGRMNPTRCAGRRSCTRRRAHAPTATALARVGRRSPGTRGALRRRADLHRACRWPSVPRRKTARRAKPNHTAQRHAACRMTRQLGGGGKR